MKGIHFKNCQTSNKKKSCKSKILKMNASFVGFNKFQIYNTSAVELNNRVNNNAILKKCRQNIEVTRPYSTT